MRLSFFFLFFSLLSLFNLNAQDTCQYKADGDWLAACCMGGASCIYAGGKNDYCYSNNLTGPACQATLKCLQDHANCNACLSTWGLKFCSLQ